MPTPRTIAIAISAGLALPAVTTSTALAQSGPFPPQLTLDELDGATGFRVDPAGGTWSLGLEVAAMGDINGDGLDDFLLGAPLSQVVAYDAGEAFVVFGRAGGFPSSWSLDELDGTNGFRLYSDRPDGYLGWDLAIAGDLNHDGYDDIAVGQDDTMIIFGRDTTGPGAFPASVYLYSLAPPEAVRLRTSRYVDPVAPAGDFNGDGMDDLLVGFSGGAFVLFGREGGFPALVDLDQLDGTDGVRIDEAADRDWAGRVLASAGDVNGDGIGDVIIGALRADSSVPDSGAAYVVFGRDASAAPFPAAFSLADLDGVGGFKLAPPEIAGGGGLMAVAGAGDINADGVDDVLVGFPDHFPTGDVHEDGAAYVVFGRDASAGPAFEPVVSLEALDGSDGFVLRGSRAFFQAGRAVSGAGDLNNDGVADIVVGTPLGGPDYPRTVGAAAVLYGRADGAFPALLNLADVPTFGGFIAYGYDIGGEAGHEVTAAGDLNGDGLDDLLLTAPFVDGGGAAYAIYGRDGSCRADLDGDGLLTIFDFLAFQNLFDAGDLAADFDGDGALTIFDFLAFQNEFDMGCE